MEKLTPEEEIQEKIQEESNIEKLLSEAEIQQADPDAGKEKEEVPEKVESEKDEKEIPEDKKEEGTSTEAAPPAISEKSPQSDEDLQKELDKIEPSEGSHPNTVKAIPVLKDKIKETNLLARELAEKLKKSEEEKKSLKILTPETEQEISQLREFRRMYAIEHDPVFMQKYDSKIKGIDSQFIGCLIGPTPETTAPEQVRKFIEDNGGLSKMAFSNKLMPDGKTTQWQWLEEEILGSLSGKQKYTADALLKSFIDLQSSRDQEVAAAKQDAGKWEAQRQEEFQKSSESWNKALLKAKESSIKQLGDDARKLDIPVTATPEEKARITTHNERIDQAEKLFEQAMKARTPEEIAQVGVLAGYSQYLYPYYKEAMDQAKANKDRADKLQEKLDKIGKAGRTARQSNAAAQSQVAPKPDLSKKVSDEDAIGKLIDDTENK